MEDAPAVARLRAEAVVDATRNALLAWTWETGPDLWNEVAGQAPGGAGGAAFALRVLRQQLSLGAAPEESLRAAERAVHSAFPAHDPQRRAALVTLLLARARARQSLALPFDTGGVERLAA